MKLFPSLFALATVGGVASAATITQTRVISPFTAGGTEIVIFNQFDPMGGTRQLDSVTLGFSFDKLGGSYAVDNDSNDSGTIVFTHELRGRLSSSDISVGSAGTYLSSLSELESPVGADDGDPQDQFDVGGPDYVTYDPADVRGTNHSAAIAASAWGAYTGTGTFSIRFEASQLFGVNGVGGLQSQTIASTVAPDITVTYNYSNVVPEPSSALLGALGSLVLLRRRR